MLFLPKTFERYVAALRLYVHMSVIYGGIREKHYRQLEIISIAEALCPQNKKEPDDIIKHSNSLLGAAVLVLMQSGISLAVSFSGDGVYLINRKLFSALLMTLISGNNVKNREIIIETDEKGITLKAFGCEFDRRIPVMIKALDGVYFREPVTDSVIISIPAEKSDKAPIKNENEWFYITDRFSPVNIFLNCFRTKTNL